MSDKKFISRILALLLALTVFPPVAGSFAFAEEVETPSTASVEPAVSAESEEAAGPVEAAEAASPAEGVEAANSPEAIELSATDTDDSSENDASLEPASEKAVRTIMFYVCGTNLETDSGMASYNLRQILASNFSADEDVRFIIMTGGAQAWWLESDYLYDPATGSSPGAISNEYNQIWEAKGLDAPDNPGKMVLLDGDGVSGDGDDAKPSAQEQMVQPETLQAFIAYCVENYPAEKYDIILWDHGGGPRGGFGQDDHHSWQDDFENNMSFAQLIDVFQNNAVTADGSRFDFINFDACVMGSVEQNLAFADYTDYYIASPEFIPGYGQYYTNWLNTVGADPYIDTFELGIIMVDDFTAFYNKPEGDGSSQEGTLAIVNTQALMDSGFVDALIDMNALLRSGVLNPDGDEYLFYNELDSIAKSISYGMATGYDLGNFASLLAVNFTEARVEDVEDGTYSDTNEYLDVAKRILAVLNDPNVIYAGGTSGIAAGYDFYLTPTGEVEYDELHTSGM